jgi:hypothetical protein
MKSIEGILMAKGSDVIVAAPRKLFWTLPD